MASAGAASPTGRQRAGGGVPSARACSASAVRHQASGWRVLENVALARAASAVRPALTAGPDCPPPGQSMRARNACGGARAAVAAKSPACMMPAHARPRQRGGRRRVGCEAAAAGGDERVVVLPDAQPPQRDKRRVGRRGSAQQQQTLQALDSGGGPSAVAERRGAPAQLGRRRVAPDCRWDRPARQKGKHHFVQRPRPNALGRRSEGQLSVEEEPGRRVEQAVGADVPEDEDRVVLGTLAHLVDRVRWVVAKPAACAAHGHVPPGTGAVQGQEQLGRRGGGRGRSGAAAGGGCAGGAVEPAYGHQ
eukprot:scaffold4107_cov95-Isochrysis_galbana.AAC.11